MAPKRDRWSEGIPHDPRSMEIVRALRRIDSESYGDYFDWRIGGDGDNGETLAYELDDYFEEKDAESGPSPIEAGKTAETLEMRMAEMERDADRIIK